MIAAYFAALAGGPAVAWAALVEVQAAGPSALARRREVLERYVDLLAAMAADLATTHPDEVRAVDRRLIVAAVGGINELMLARVERGDVEHLRRRRGRRGRRPDRPAGAPQLTSCGSPEVTVRGPVSTGRTPSRGLAGGPPAAARAEEAP